MMDGVTGDEFDDLAMMDGDSDPELRVLFFFVTHCKGNAYHYVEVFFCIISGMHRTRLKNVCGFFHIG